MSATDPAPGAFLLFVSYHRADEETYGMVRYLQAHVPNRFKSQTGRTLEMFVDTEIPGGTEWQEKISVAARSCDFFLPLLSISYLNSRYCLDELQWFLESKTRPEQATSIIPIPLINPDPGCRQSRVLGCQE